MRNYDYIRNRVFPSITAVIIFIRNNGMMEIEGPYGRMTVPVQEWEKAH